MFRRPFSTMVLLLGMVMALGAAGFAAETTAVVRETLPNGLRVVIVPNRLAPVVATQVTYLAGSNDSPPGFPGMAHALEHMMFRGSAGLDKDQLYELGDLLGGAYNANTEETVTNYTYSVPAADLGLILRVEALRMHGASITQADWEQERGAIEQEVSRNLSSPMYELFSTITAALFAGTPYEHDALGTRDSFNATDAAMLRKYYETWYHPNNAILIIAGDVDSARALEEARAAFGPLQAVPVPAHPTSDVVPATASTIRTQSNLPVGLIGQAYRMPGLASPDRAAADVLAEIIGSERGPLYALGVDGKALQTGFSLISKTDVGIGLAYGAFPVGQDPAPLIADLKRVLALTAAGDIPDDLFDAAKRSKIAALAFANDDIAGLARSWGSALAVGLRSPGDLVRAYQAVGLDDVRRLARAALDDAHAITSIVTPRGENRPAAGAGFGGAETIGSPPDHSVELPAWAAAALAEMKVPDLGALPDVTTLPNGLRLIVVPEHVSPTVSVYGRIRTEAAMQEPAGQEGVAALTNQLFPYGTMNRDRLAFSKATDDITVSVRNGTDFALQALAPQFEAGMRLLAENQLHPAFPEDAFVTVRQQLAQSVAGQLRSPPYRFSRAERMAIVPANDPSLREATPATIGALTLDQVRAYFQAAYRPDLATIVVVGDVSAEQARRVVTDTLGGWSGPAAPALVDLPKIGPSASTGQHIPDAGATQGKVSLIESIGIEVGDPQRYRLMLGNTILGNGFSSRLFRDLRTRTGYVYGHRSQLEFTRSRSTYKVGFGADPVNVAKARALVVRNIEEMQRTLVTDAELRRAKAQTLRRLAMSRASVSGIAAQYLSQADLGLPIDAPQRAAAQYAATTAEEIRQAFATWLRPNDLAEIVQGPAKE